MRKRIVLKFGGTSMGSADAMRKAGAIVRSVDGEAVVVVSAVSGTTDALIALGRAAVGGGDWEAALNEIRTRHAAIVASLGLDVGLKDFWSEMEQICQGVAQFGELTPSILDRLLSLGERLSTAIFAACLNADGTRAEMVDAFHVVATDRQFGSANVDFALTNARAAEVLSPMLAASVVPVVTGFVGRSDSNRYTTLGRGGSDYSAAIVAAAVDATELQIWTDVDGMFTADPRLIPAATALPQLSYAEAGELAYFGAKVLHPKTIKPAIERGIPVRVLNTFHAEAPGTLITSEKRPSLKSVTSRKGITVLNIDALPMLGASGFLGTVGDAFRRHQVVVDVLASSEVSISVTVDQAFPEALLDDLRAFATVDVDPHKAIICLVGEGIRTDLDVLWKLFYAVRTIPIRMVSQGASQRNITFAVAETDADFAVRQVFQAFFNS
ncbi:aspartate kinase [bacterium]|nr:aspartate kinase [bacterium]